MQPTAFKQVKNNARTKTKVNELNNTTASLAVGVDSISTFPTFPGNTFWVTAWNKDRYADPGDDPAMRIGICTAIDSVNKTMTVTWGQFSTPITAVKGKIMIALLVVDQHLKDIYAAVNALETTRQSRVFYTVGFSNADYTTDGVADNVEIQAAIDAAFAAGGGTVYIKDGNYQIANTVVLRPTVSVFGAGIGQTVIALSPAFAAGVGFRENSGAANNIEVTGITFDFAAKVNVGYLHIYQGDNVNVHHNEFKNMSASDPASKWGVRLGQHIEGNAAGSQSRNVTYSNNVMSNSNTGTFEQLLYVNQSRGHVQNNYWKGNTNSLAYELMLYINCQDNEVSGNVFENPQANSIGVMESRRNNLHNNQFYHNASFKSFTVINSTQTKIENNIAENTLNTNSSTFVDIFDRVIGPDNFTQHVTSTEDLSIRGNSVKGYKFTVSAQIGGTVNTTAYRMEYNGIVIENNDIYNSLSSPIIIGVADIANKIQNLFIKGNNIFSWTAGSAGAFQLRGYTTDPTQFSNIVIKDNFVANSTDNTTNGAVRAIGCTIKEVAYNNFDGISGNGITTANGGVIQYRHDNTGTYDVDAKARTYVTVSRVATTTADYICDGVQDDVEIQAAINQVSAAGGGTVFIRSGLYRISATLVIPEFVRILGEKFVKGSTGGVTLKTSASVSLTNLISFTGATNPTTNAQLFHDIGFEQMTLDGNNTTTNLVLLTNSDYVVFDHIRFIQATNSIRTAWNSTTDPTATTFPGGIRINRCLISSVSGIGIDLQYQTQCWISDSWFSGTTVATWINFKSSNKIHIVNCEFNAATTAFRFQDTATFPTTDITAIGNVFAVGTGNKSWTEERTNALSQRVVIMGGTIVTGVLKDTLINAGNIDINSDYAPGTVIQFARRAIADANATVTSADYEVAYTSITAARTVTLPAPGSTLATATRPQSFLIKDESGAASGANTITIAVSGGATIDGAANKQIMNAYGSYRLYTNGTTYFTS